MPLILRCLFFDITLLRHYCYAIDYAMPLLRHYIQLSHYITAIDIIFIAAHWYLARARQHAFDYAAGWLLMLIVATCQPDTPF